MTPYEFIVQTVLYIVCIAFVYFLLVTKPRLDEENKKQKFLQGLKKNDEVITSGGLLGRVFAVKADIVTVEIAQNVRVKVRAVDVHSVPKGEEEREQKLESASVNEKK